MKNDVYDLPESLYEFAYIPNYHTTIQSLAQLAEDEDWSYHSTPSPDTNYPILENYVNNTYRRIAVEKKVAYSAGNKYCCFDTGLVSRTQREPIYMLFAENTNTSQDCYWFFRSFSGVENLMQASFLSCLIWPFIGTILLNWYMTREKSW